MNKQIDQIDIQAESEGTAISSHRQIAIQSHGRDDNKLRSKNYYLRNTVADTFTSHKQHRPRSSRQLNLQTLRICQRLNDPTLYEQYK